MDNHEQNQGCKFLFDSLAERVEKLEDKTTNIPVFEKLLDEFMRSNRIQGEAIVRLDRTLDKISLNLEGMNKSQEQFKVDQEKMRESIENLKEERNINFIAWFKSNWFTILLAIYALYETYQKISG